MKKASLLLVEDDDCIVEIYSSVLAGLVYQVSSARSGEEAYACAAAAPYDMAIVDVLLATGTSGIEVAQRLRDEWSIPSLFTSAYDDPHTVERAVTVGGLGYLVKPVSPAMLVPAIEAALARARDLKSLTAYSDNLRIALEKNRAISMAIGAVMATEGLSEKQAFERLRQTARSKRGRVEDVAQQVIAALPKKLT